MVLRILVHTQAALLTIGALRCHCFNSAHPNRPFAPALWLRCGLASPLLI
jgi:hypothetical protein